MDNLTVLYRKNAIGIGVWTIYSENAVIHISSSSVLNGAKTEWIEVVKAGKAGRSLQEQVLSRINSRISRQRDKGYVDSIEEAELGAYNQLGLIPPMLAQTYKGQTIPDNFRIQPKYNGLRCLITRQDGELIAYSRKGKRIDTIYEILKDVGRFVQEGQTLDGELYHHGTSLQTISSWARRRQMDTSKLLYIVYDQISNDGFDDRYDELKDQIAGRGPCILANTLEYISKRIADEMFKFFRQEGYEGMMIRDINVGYESNKRSSSLLKMKSKHDAEVIITDIVLSEKGYPVLVTDYHGRTLRVNTPGTRENQKYMYEHKHAYIGRVLQIEFREFTDDGVPFHAVATNFRGEF